MSESLFKDGIAAWAANVRSGRLSFEETLRQCVSRIESDKILNAWEITDASAAVTSAKAMDALLASGTDLGWSMGLPLAVKDIIRADGFPITNGSNADTADCVGPEGSIVKRCKQAGMVVVGKTRTVEFALGVTGQNTSRGTPWNPHDRDTHRLPGGIPAAFNGITGHKTSVRLWPTDGVFSLSTTLDSIGPLCQTVGDCGLVHHLITGEAIPPARAINGLRIGVPQEHFFEDLDDQVKRFVVEWILSQPIVHKRAYRSVPWTINLRYAGNRP